MWKIAAIMFILGTAGLVQAQQPNPTVEIILDQPTAQMGQTVTAQVYVRGAVNMAGSDVGISVDPACLTVIDRQLGEFLPTEADKGGYSAFSELNAHDTRLAASLIRRSHIANGDGVFFRVRLQVTCETGVAPVTVSFVELTQIEDLEAENATFLVYKMDKGNINTVNTQLVINARGNTTPNVVTAPVDATAVIGGTPTGETSISTAVSTPAIQATMDTVRDETAESTQQSPLVLVIVVGLALVGLATLVVVVRIVRRQSRNNNQE